MKKIILSITLSVLGAALYAQPKDSTSTGFIETISAESLNYPSTDLRGMLTGRFVGLDIREVNGELTSMSQSALSSYNAFEGNISGTSRFATDNILFVVDDVPVVFTQLVLDPSQIETISFVSSVADKAKYGPLASNGVIHVRTKHGAFNTPKKITASVDAGYSVMDRTGEWVNAYEYADLNNLARSNAGYPMLYSSEALKGYAGGNAYDKYYPSVDFRSLMISEGKPVARFSVSATGGGKGVAYAVGVSGATEGGYHKGGSSHDMSRININSNVTAKIGKWMTANIGMLGTVRLWHTPNLDYASYRYVPANAYPLSFGENGGLIDDISASTMIYGVSKQWSENYYAMLQTGRFYTGRSTTGQINASLDVDLSFLLKGLKSRTYIGIGMNDMSRVYKADDYLAYYWSTGVTEPVEQSSSHKGTKATSKTKSTQSAWQQINFYEDLSWNRTFGAHKAEVGAMYYIADSRIATDSFFERQQDLIGRASYSYDGKYNAEFVADYSGSSMFAAGSRFAFFPSAGLSWVVSKENFLKDSRVVNLLKIRAQAGIIGAANNVISDAKNLWDSRYTKTTGITFGPAANGRWFGELQHDAGYTTITRLDNPDLSWEKIYQADLGVDAKLFGCLDLMAQYYYAERNGIVTEISTNVPDYFGLKNTSIYDNYNCIRYQGFEAAIGYCGKWGDFSLKTRAAASSCRGVYTKYAGDIGKTSGQAVTGSEIGAIWGLICTGKFRTEAQLQSTPKYNDIAGIGDLMYKDANGNGIVDSNDQRVIGNSNPKLRYSLTLDLSWRKWDLGIVATGRAFCQVALTNAYYWNGWGDDNYSAFVRDNLGGDYPTISYVKNTNNFVASDFWLRNGGYFKIQNVELAYNFSGKSLKKAGIDRIRVYVQGANLLTLSAVKDLDPESLSAGVSAAPLYKTVLGGVKFNF